MTDAGGAPAEGKPLATLDLVLDASDVAAWHDALVPTPFDTGDATALWAVVKGKSGTVEWTAPERARPRPARDALHERRRNLAALPGARRASSEPLLRVLREPIARENAPLLTLVLANGRVQRLCAAAIRRTIRPRCSSSSCPRGKS